MAKVAILGSGGWGTALAYALSKKNDVVLWSYFEKETEALKKYRENKPYLPGVILPGRIIFTSRLEDAVGGARLVIFAVPSFAVRQTSRDAGRIFNPLGQIAVCAAKGLEENTFLTLSEVIADELPRGSIVCALSGPTHAEEVARNIPTAVVSACAGLSSAKTVQDICMTDTFRVYTSADIKGVEIAGAVKNIIALCAGISDGAGYGDNTKAALMTRGMYEISKLGTAMGGKPETFYGLAGMGDLIVTCTSMHSRNRRAGILIGQGKTADEAAREVNMVVEGIRALKAVKKASEKYRVEMPIINEAYSIVYEGGDPGESVGNLMTRLKKDEI
jgi:glycerol-3-phosphate dehydrogenase (NAD(P)+)